MRHDWIFEVLKDLGSYAALNGLPALAAQVDEALKIARLEIGPADPAADPAAAPGVRDLPPKGRAH